MNKTCKRLLSCIIAFAICFHFVNIAVYCFPQQLENSKLQIVNKMYVYPIFQQNWALFVPAPDVERKLFVRYKTANGFSDWIDILSREIVSHKQNRLLGNEAIVLLLSNSLIYELNSLHGVASTVYVSNKNNPELKVLKFEVEQYLKSKFKITRFTNYELLMVASAKDQQQNYYVQNLTIH